MFFYRKIVFYFCVAFGYEQASINCKYCNNVCTSKVELIGLFDKSKTISEENWVAEASIGKYEFNSGTIEKSEGI